jgi:hypothetical protein
MIDSALEFNLEDGNVVDATASLGDINFAQSDIGTGHPLWLNITCLTTGTGAGTVTYTLRTAAATASLAAGAIIMNSGAIVGTSHEAGQMVYSAPLPASGAVLGRVRLMATVASTVGVVEVRAWIGSEPQSGLGIRAPITDSA